MTNQTSIKYISALLDKPETISEGDHSSIALFRQTFPYFVPTRYLVALESHKKTPYTPQMLSALQPYMGDWMLLCDFLNAGTRAPSALPPVADTADKKVVDTHPPAPVAAEPVAIVPEPPAPVEAAPVPAPEPVIAAVEEPLVVAQAPPVTIPDEEVSPFSFAPVIAIVDEKPEIPVFGKAAQAEAAAEEIVALHPDPETPGIVAEPEIVVADVIEPFIEIEEPAAAVTFDPPQPVAQPVEIVNEIKESFIPLVPQPVAQPVEIVHEIKESFIPLVPLPVVIDEEPEPEPAVAEEPVSPAEPAIAAVEEAVPEPESVEEPLAIIHESVVIHEDTIAPPEPAFVEPLAEVEIPDMVSPEPGAQIFQDSVEESAFAKAWAERESVAEEVPAEETETEDAVEIVNDTAGTTEPGTGSKEYDPLIFPIYTKDYFLQQGEKISEEIPLEINELKDAGGLIDEEDKSLMVVMSFSEWLLHFKNSAERQKEETKDQKALKTMWQKEKLAAAMEEENEEIPETVFEMAVNSISKEEGLVSETLAEIHIKQGKYDKAIEMYRKLSLRNPQKSAYFARKIEEALKDKQS